MVVLLELMAGGILREEQLGEILKAVDRVWRKRVEPIKGYSLQAGGEDPVQNGVVSYMNHHIVLILAEVLDLVALIRVSEVGIVNFLKNSHSNMPSEKGS